ncbi:MAG: hypothetical protein K8S99_16560 [Planctomycetes bacterium]|nr:hypothetical protein [Planctomycetota bacterium]
MIHYVVTAGHEGTITRFLREWAPRLAPRVRILYYESLPGLRHATPGTYIFSDLERLNPPQLRLAAEFHRRLAAAGPAFRLLNDPTQTLTRYHLLHLLHGRGLNPFRCYRHTDPIDDCRFPVFVRHEHNHNGSLTDLIHTRGELDEKLRTLPRTLSRRRRRDLLIVEFCDTSDGGLFRKYSAMRIGDRLIPRHVFFSRNWVNKEPDLVDALAGEEERRFVDHFPQRDAVWEIFRSAQIDFGRMDFGVLDGRVVVWEINTNPQFLVAQEDLHPLRAETQQRSGNALIDAMQSLDADAPNGAAVPVFTTGDLPLTLRARLSTRLLWSRKIEKVQA